MEVGLCLGSNLGNRLRYLQWAKAWLLMIPGVRFVDQSSVYETSPVDVAEAYSSMSFLNAVLVLESDLTAEEWLPQVNRIEAELSRVRTGEINAPRTIDIDILFAGETNLETETLQVPHARWSERRFVATPLAEVRGDWVLPRSTLSVRDVLAQLPAGDEVHVLQKTW